MDVGEYVRQSRRSLRPKANCCIRHQTSNNSLRSRNSLSSSNNSLSSGNNSLSSGNNSPSSSATSIWSLNNDAVSPPQQQCFPDPDNAATTSQIQNLSDFSCQDEDHSFDSESSAPTTKDVSFNSVQDRCLGDRIQTWIFAQDLEPSSEVQYHDTGSQYCESSIPELTPTPGMKHHHLQKQLFDADLDCHTGSPCCDSSIPELISTQNTNCQHLQKQLFDMDSDETKDAAASHKESSSDLSSYSSDASHSLDLLHVSEMDADADRDTSRDSDAGSYFGTPVCRHKPNSYSVKNRRRVLKRLKQVRRRIFKYGMENCMSTLAVL